MPPRFLVKTFAGAAALAVAACSLVIDTAGLSGEPVLDAAQQPDAADAPSGSDVTTTDARDVAVVDAPADAPTARSLRAGMGLVALYDFEESSGATVSDVSGIAPALDLTMAAGAQTTRVPGGLSIDGPSFVASAGAATKIIERCKLTSEVSIEAWVKPANTTQTTARIAALGGDVGSLDVVLAQNGQEIDSVLRTTTNTNDLLTTSGASLAAKVVHVVTTRAASGKRVTYVDAVPTATGTLGGDFSSWDPGFALGLANNPSRAAAWLGTYYLVAIYDQALTAAEVSQLSSAGP